MVRDKASFGITQPFIGKIIPLRTDLSLQSLGNAFFVTSLGLLRLLFQSGKGQFVFFPVTPTSLQFKDILPCRVYELARYKKKLPSYTFPKALLVPLQNHLLLKPVHQIVSKHHQLKPAVVPSPTVGYYIVQTKGVDSLFDKVLTVCPLVIKSPYLDAALGTVGGNHLIVVYGIIPLYEGKLLLRLLALSHLFPDDNQPTEPLLTKGKWELFHRDSSANRFPAPLIEDDLLNPLLKRNGNIKLYTFLLQPPDKLYREESTVSSKPLYTKGQSLYDGGKKSPGVIAGMVFATSQAPSQKVPGLPYETENGMVALPPPLLWIESSFRPLLVAKHSAYMGVKVCSYTICEVLKPFPYLQKQGVVYLVYLSGYAHIQPLEEPAYGRLGRKPLKLSYPLKHLISCQLHHMVGTAQTKEDAIKDAEKHLLRRVSSILLYPNLLKIETDAYPVKVSSYKPCSSESSEVLACELFLNFFVGRNTLFGHILIHFLSASFLWLLVLRIYHRGGYFTSAFVKKEKTKSNKS